MAVDDVAVLRVVGEYQSQNIVNTMHYRITAQAGANENQWQELVEEWLDAHDSAWLARHIDSYTLVGVKAFTVKGDTRPPGEKSLGNAGTVVGATTLSFIGRTITLYGDSANARRRGRIMLSGGEDTMFTGSRGSVSDGEVLALTALGSQLIQPIDTGDNTYDPVLFQKLPETITGLILAKGRVTPSSIRSRRVRKFLIG